ncbi:MAG: hypothetical protein R3A48_28220 [Polyangiales bacterium]
MQRSFARNARWVLALTTVLAACGEDGGNGGGDGGGGGGGGQGAASGNCTSGSMVPGRWAATMSGTEADFVGAFGTSPDSLVAVADTVARRHNGMRWIDGPGLEFTRMEGMSLLSLRLTAVGGFDAMTTFAAGIVGTDGGGEAPTGEMYRLTATAATQVNLPIANVQIVSIRGSAANNIWAVGGGYALRYDGMRFQNRSMGIPPGTDLYDVWAFSENDVWAVGTKVLHWDGTTWSDALDIGAGSYFGIWGSAPNNLYIVGNSVMRRYDGTTWRTVLTNSIADLRTVWGSSASDVWAAGEGGTVVHYDGNAWGPVSSGITTRITRLWGFGANNVWAVGERGVALNYTYSGNPSTPTPAPCNYGTPEGLGDGMGTRLTAVNQSVCARRSNGQVFCWGNNNSRQLGDGTTMTQLAPIQIPALTDVAHISISSNHGCAAKNDGTVWCWAEGRSGQLGNGMDLIASPTPVRAGEIADAVGVSVSAQTSCALRRTGNVQCWGFNQSGQVGDGTMDQRTFPVTVAGFNDIVQITSGLSHTCGRRANGGVICWGAGTLGQLGNGATMNSSQAVVVQGIVDANFIAAGANHTCAVRLNGTVVCWGANAAGQLGDGTTTNRPAPVPVMGVTDASAVGGGLSHTCFVRRGGALRCVGQNMRGQLGDRTTMDRTTPVDVMGVTDAARVAGGSDFTCVTRANGAVTCFGGNANGQLGRGAMNASQPEPAAPNGL